MSYTFITPLTWSMNRVKSNLYTLHLSIPRRMSIFHAKNCITRGIYARKYVTTSMYFPSKFLFLNSYINFTGSHRTPAKASPQIFGDSTESYLSNFMFLVLLFLSNLCSHNVAKLYPLLFIRSSMVMVLLLKYFTLYRKNLLIVNSS